MGQRIAIVTDSTADFPKGVAQKLGIHFVPVHIDIDGMHYLDGVTITSDQLVARMHQGSHPTTRPGTPAEYAEIFETLLHKKGYDRILSFQLSSKLSDCYNSAQNALSLLSAEDARKVEVFDTGTLSIGQAVYTILAIRYIRTHGSLAGMKESLDTIMASSINNITVNNLSWLRKSGALGAIPAMVGTMLDIKPIIALKEGSLKMVNRVRGMKETLDEMASYGKRKKEDHIWEVWVAHCDAEENAFYLRDRLARALGKEIRSIRIVEAGASISVKLGPGSCCWGMIPYQL